MIASGDELIGRWVVEDLHAVRRLLGGIPGWLRRSPVGSAVERPLAAATSAIDATMASSTATATADATDLAVHASETSATTPSAFGFPIMLEVRGQRVVIVGGGREPAHKAEALARLGANVVVWAAEHVETAALADRSGIELTSGPFDPAVLDGARLAIISTGERVLDRHVATEARARGALVNTIDDIPYCDWSAPAILRRGDLTVAFATAGIAPALAVRLRDRLADEVGPEYADLLAIFGEVRPRIMASGRSFGSRRRLWYGLVDGPALDFLRAGDRSAAREAVLAAIEAWEAAS